MLKLGGLVGAVLLCSCANDSESEVIASSYGVGALLDVKATSSVGVRLNEIPANMRDRVVQDLLAKPDSFWQERAVKQLKLATYQLVFREYFYNSPKKQLPLPPSELWQITLSGTPVRVTTPKHDIVQVDYQLHTTILTDMESPAISEPKLAKVGGTWAEAFTFPVDPELLFQRTRFACMDEADFPRGSVDSEEVDTFYDQWCGPENALTIEGCHQTEMPSKTCKQALRDFVGQVDTSLVFTRLAWNQELADSVRINELTSTTGADMQVYLPDFEQNRVEYKYFEPNSCEIQESCVGGPGWRRVLQFHSSDQNTGNETLDIGPVDYYVEGTSTLNDTYNIFEHHACHNHYHFTHYGEFSFAAQGAATTTKQGFCLQSTDRVANHEISPLHNSYAGCHNQGVEVGWVDQYKMGLPCQWVDVTNVNTAGGPVTAPITFTSNPDGFLCEGSPVLGPDGMPEFELTSFLSKDGEPVYRPKCEFSSGWQDNNSHSYNATVPKPGESFVTHACKRNVIGPLRNCELGKRNNRLACDAGQQETLRCTLPTKTTKPQFVRVCEYSAALGVGLACRYEHAVANQVIETGTVDIPFTCPSARGAGEPGGAISVYGGAVYQPDGAAAVSCRVL